jgi:hypothetical protein
MSQGSGDATEGNNATSHQMGMLVPSFGPSKDDLEQYTQKVELLSEIRPANKMNDLITRLVLNTSGRAFQKLQLNRTKLMTGDRSGTQLLITTLGGQWGKVSLEKTYEIVARALFKCVQRQEEDEDDDSKCCGLQNHVLVLLIDLLPAQGGSRQTGNLIFAETFASSDSPSCQNAEIMNRPSEDAKVSTTTNAEPSIIPRNLMTTKPQNAHLKAPSEATFKPVCHVTSCHQPTSSRMPQPMCTEVPRPK